MKVNAERKSELCSYLCVLSTQGPTTIVFENLMGDRKHPFYNYRSIIISLPARSLSVIAAIDRSLVFGVLEFLKDAGVFGGGFSGRAQRAAQVRRASKYRSYRKMA